MNTRLFRWAAMSATCVGLSLVAGACAVPAGTPDTEALPPTIVTQLELEGREFQINPEQPLVISVDDVLDWTGDVEDNRVAQFVPGADDGSAQFNPAFEAVGRGSTLAFLTSPAGETYEFTLVVP